MPRLRRADPSAPGIARRRAGNGFRYTWPDGSAVREPAVRERIAALAVPPAWREVWICPWPNGHIQAVGTDAAGRRQYRYHDQWRQQRDRQKFDHVLTVAAELPRVRAVVTRELAGPGLSRSRVLAAAVRLLDLGFFRVGGEAYAEAHGTYGLATLLRSHVSIDGTLIRFDYTAKHGQHRVQEVVDPDVLAVVRELLDRDDPGPELLAWWDADTRAWVDVRSSDINDYLREVFGTEVSAKDFRTWAATMLAAVALAVSATVTQPGPGSSRSRAGRARTAPARARAGRGNSSAARSRAVARAVREVAGYLGNTPAVCRSSYIDPRIIDRFADGATVADQLGELAAPGLPALQGRMERAVLDLLAGEPATATGRAAGAEPAAPLTAAARR